MMTKQNPFIGGHEIASVVVALGGSCTRVIQSQQTCGDERGIKTVSNQVTTGGGHHEPGGIQRFAAMKSNPAERASSNQCHNDPDDNANGPLHFLVEFLGEKFPGGIVCERVPSVNRFYVKSGLALAARHAAS